MQALSNFTWMPSLMQNQTAHRHTPYMHQESLACTKPRPKVVTDFSFLKNNNASKRKRTDTWTSTTSNAPAQETSSSAVKKQKLDVVTPVQSKTQALLHSPPVWQVAPPQQNQAPTHRQQSQTPSAVGGNASKSTTIVSSCSAPHTSSTGNSNLAHPIKIVKASEPLGLPSKDTASAPAPAPSSASVPPPPPAAVRAVDTLPSKSQIQMPLKLKDTPEAKAKAREIVESQLNLEILLKHQELRLIEQELAKCQVSLEQIRRCQVIPYPGQDGQSTSHEQISTGVGPALAPPQGFTRPRHPAPWGVTDGPYTRHYAKWLLPDSAFDSTMAAGKGSAGSGPGLRSMRGSYFDNTSSSRYHRGSVASKFHSLPANYTAPPPKDRNAPLIIKRPSDGQMVKLVCKFCQKDNISSVQGFLNHCRIAHQKSYESHGEAAEECGIAMDPSETNATAPAPTAAVATTTALTTPTTELAPHRLPSQQQYSVSIPIQSTPTSAVASPFAGKPFVHPLIMQQQQQAQPSRAIHPAKTTAKSARGLTAATQDAGTRLSTISPADNSSSFVPSLQTPRLSALLQKRGITGNLSRLVTDSQQKCNIDEISYIGGEECVEEGVVEDSEAKTSFAGTHSSCGNSASSTASLNSGAPQLVARVPSRGGPSSKLQATPADSVNKDSAAASTLSFKLSSFGHDAAASSDIDDSLESGMSPHTVDTNPGLTEDEAYGPGEDSDDQDGHSTLTDGASPSTEAMELDVEVRDFGEHTASNGRSGMRRHSRGHEHDSQDVKVLSRPPPPPPPPQQPVSPRNNDSTSLAASTPKSTVPVKRKRGRPAKERKGSVDSSTTAAGNA